MASVPSSVNTIIHNDEEHEIALAEFDALVALDPAPGSPERDRLKLLILVIDDYESRRWQAELPDAISAIEFYMDQMGLSRSDLIPYLGDRFMVSKVLSGKRGLSMNQVRALHDGLGIPAELLIRPRVQPASAGINEVAVDRPM